MKNNKNVIKNIKLSRKKTTNKPKVTQTIKK